MDSKTIKKILKLRDSKISTNEIQCLVGCSKGSVINTISRADKATLGLDRALAMNDEELQELFYPPPNKVADEDFPDFEALRPELARKGVNVQLLWEEYHEKHPCGLKRSAFYNNLKLAGPPEEPKPNLHQIAKGGERLQLDYSGLTASYFDEEKGTEVEVQIFVASWMASSYLYVEASPSQQKEDWVASNARALRFFGCAPTYLVPDNLKSGVTKANFYDPKINHLYESMATHYGSVVLPARARRPQDKASVESNVRFIQTHILGRLRDRKFRSLVELNEAIWALLHEINGRPMQRYHLSRRERFEQLDLPNATKLPDTDFSVQDIKDGVLVGEDHHVHYNDHYYSAPWRLTGSRVNLMRMGNELMIYSDGERVASHPISHAIGGYTTNDTHRPPNHLFVLNLKPLWVLNEAKKIGPRTQGIISNMISADPSHSEVPIRKGLGIIELTREFPADRVESAVGWAIDHAMVKVEDIKRVLVQRLDLEGSAPRGTPVKAPCAHPNIRGPEHYTQLFSQ